MLDSGIEGEARYAIQPDQLVARPVAPGLVAARGCGAERCSYGQKDYQNDIAELWNTNPNAGAWRLDVGVQLVTPHGDKDGPQSGGVVGAAKGVASGFDQQYLLLYESKKVPRFRMLGHVDIPANDSRPFEDRASGHLSLWPERINQMPDPEGFMTHWVAETRGDSMLGYTEDMTLGSKYPGMRVYRTQDNRNVAGTQMEDFTGRDGPMMGYDTAKRQWVTLEPAKPKPTEPAD